jgi:hypothetical protein
MNCLRLLPELPNAIGSLYALNPASAGVTERDWDHYMHSIRLQPNDWTLFMNCNRLQPNYWTLFMNCLRLQPEVGCAGAGLSQKNKRRIYSEAL